MRAVDGPTDAAPDRPAASRRGEALDWAAAARARRDRVRDELRDGTTSLGDVLAGRLDDPELGVVRLLWVLESVPGARKVDTRRRLVELGVDASSPLSMLDDALVTTLLGEFSETSAAPG